MRPVEGVRVPVCLSALQRYGLYLITQHLSRCFYNLFSTTPCRRRFPTVAPAAHFSAVFALAKCHVHPQVDKLSHKRKVRIKSPAKLHIFEVYAGVLCLQCSYFCLYGFEAALFGLYHFTKYLKIKITAPICTSISAR
jgi:hypothetical protein